MAMGQTKGKTLLPLPPQQDRVAPTGDADKNQDKDKVHVLESAIVTWSTRIEVALKRNPESLFAKGAHPGARTSAFRFQSCPVPARLFTSLGVRAGPHACLDFWASKMTDLGEILDQINGAQVQKVLKVLELIRSPYAAAAALVP